MTRERPEPESLPPAAADAWRAYRRMLDSKSAHFGFLETLAEKYRHGGQRSLAEQARLATLLDEHDRRVKDFAAAMKRVATDAPQARETLIGLMKESAAGDPATTH